jgi:DNA-binding response OmpR family regulator
MNRPRAPRGRRTILLVEDEERLAQAIATGLTAEGFSVDIVHNGGDGLQRATEGRYAAIVLDILLPDVNGYEICAALREREVWTPILMLTAKDGEYDEAEALDTGADDFLSKPFSYVVLVARLRALIRRGDAPRPLVMQVGDLELDPAARTCRRASDSRCARRYAPVSQASRSDFSRGSSFRWKPSRFIT